MDKWISRGLNLGPGNQVGASCRILGERSPSELRIIAAEIKRLSKRVSRKYKWGWNGLQDHMWRLWCWMIPRFPAQQLGWKFQYLKWRSKEEDQVGATGTILVPLWLRSYRRSVWSHLDWKDEIWNREDGYDQWFSTWEKAVISILNKFVYVLLIATLFI